MASFCVCGKATCSSLLCKVVIAAQAKARILNQNNKTLVEGLKLWHKSRYLATQLKWRTDANTVQMPSL